jgi:Fur family ferric uptake transcriptional regulator
MAVSSNEKDWFWGKLEKYLESANLKQSKQRNSIVAHFLDLDEHVSAEGLHQYMRSKKENTGLATVYRTLNLLKEAGLVEQKQFLDGKAVYEVVKPDSHHDHLICTICDRVIEFENEEIEKLQKQVAESFGFRLDHHRLDLFGTCLKVNCDYRSEK